MHTVDLCKKIADFGCVHNVNNTPAVVCERPPHCSASHLKQIVLVYNKTWKVQFKFPHDSSLILSNCVRLIWNRQKKNQ